MSPAATRRRTRRGPVASWLEARARRRRYRTFAVSTGLAPDDRILDAGAGLRALDRSHEIVELDGAVSALPFADGEFDVAHCDSLIEHVPPGERKRLADDVRRVADRWFVRATRLERRELERLFPDAVIVRERVGLTRSLVAVGPRGRVPA